MASKENTVFRCSHCNCNCNYNCRYNDLYSNVSSKLLLGCFTRLLSIKAESQISDIKRNRNVESNA